MRKLTFALSTALLLASCTDFSPTEDTKSAESKVIPLNFNYSANSDIAKNAQVAIIVIKNGDKVISEQQLTVTETSIIGQITALPANESYTFTLNVFDANNSIIYTGSANAEIIADETANIEIILEKVIPTGNAEIIGIIKDPTEKKVLFQLSTTKEYITADGSVVSNFGTEINDGYVFDSEDYINAGNSESCNFENSSFSISFSIKSGIQDGTILSKYRGGVGTPENGWTIQCENSEADRAGIRLDLSDGYYGRTGLLASGIETLDNQWHDVAISFNRVSGMAKMTIDGIVKDSADISQIGSLQNNDDLYIGWRGDYWYHLDAAVDDITILNYATL